MESVLSGSHVLCAYASMAVVRVVRGISNFVHSFFLLLK